jgi:hypothetical protein
MDFCRGLRRQARRERTRSIKLDPLAQDRFNDPAPVNRLAQIALGPHLTLLTWVFSERQESDDLFVFCGIRVDLAPSRPPPAR